MTSKSYFELSLEKFCFRKRGGFFLYVVPHINQIRSWICSMYFPRVIRCISDCFWQVISNHVLQIYNTAIRNYIAAILNHFPPTTAFRFFFCFFFFHGRLKYVKLILHERIHDASADTVKESYNKHCPSLSAWYSPTMQTTQGRSTGDRCYTRQHTLYSLERTLHKVEYYGFSTATAWV